MTRNAAEIFCDARELPPEQRAIYLERACAEDRTLRAEVYALLQADAAAGRFMASPTSGSATPPEAALPDTAPQQEQAGAHIGRYKLLQQIGEGGMGTIWMAEQREPVKRRVALKIIKLGMDTKQVIARFEAERQALAMMDHPHIAKVFDAGTTETGRPYFVMEYIKGIPILEYCDREKLDTRARLGLFANVCSAIQHAHQKGIIHRDIKPSNVLLTLHDGVPVPKIIDFGIAKATNSELTTKTLFTEHHQMIGTPAYMSPEQAEMSGLDIDTRSDVYSLGVLLYELLTGTTPFDVKTLLSRGLVEMMRVIREEDPRKPSDRISTLGATGTRTAEQRRIDVKGLGTLLRGDLDWIVMKCLEKDRRRRYETANELAADIHRHLRHEPVAAGSPGAAYRLRKFARRNRVQVIASGLVLLALLVAATGALWGYLESNRAQTLELERRLGDEKRAAAEDARSSRNAAAVTSLLDRCEAALRAGDVAEAQSAIGEARKRSAEAGGEKEAGRIEALAADLALLDELIAIDHFRWDWIDNRFPDAEVVAVRTRDALRRFGADSDAVSAEESAARVNASVVRERVVTALDRWLQHDRSANVRAVLRQVDPDPFRDAIRDAVVTRDKAKVDALASQDEALSQPPHFATILGEIQSIAAERRRALLEAALVRRSGDVGLLMTLGTLAYTFPTDPEGSAIERMRWFQAAIAADPDNLVARNDLAGLLTELGEADAALGYLERALALDPSNTSARANLGHTLTRMGRVDEAIEQLQGVIRTNPDVAAAHSNLGIALRTKGRWDDAVASHLRAAALQPGSAEYECELGVTLTLRGDLEEAIARLQHAIQQGARFAPAYVALGVAMRLAGRAEEAITWHSKAVALDPKNAQVRLGLSQALAGAGRVDAAIATARKAVELDPESLRFRLHLGAVLCEHARDYEAALASFEAAIALDAKSAAARTGKGSALLGRGLVADAIRCHRAAIGLDPQHAEARCGLARALARTAARKTGPDAGDPARLCQEALDALRAALELYAGQLKDGNLEDRVVAKQALRTWREDPDLAGVRDAAALAALPPEQRRACAKLWADAAQLLEEAETATQPTPAGAADGPDPVVPLLEATLKQKRARFGPDHPETVQATWRLGHRYGQTGKLDLALPLLEEALKRAQAAYGPDNLSTPSILNELGAAYWSMGRLDKSIPLLEESLRLMTALEGREHPRAIMTVANLGLNYKAAGRLAEAVPLLMEAQLAAAKPPGMRWVSDQLLDVLPKLEPAAAAKHWAGLLPSLRKELGDDHQDTVLAVFHSGRALALSKRFVEAEPLLEEAVERARRAFGPDHPNTPGIMNGAGASCFQAGRFDRAAALFEESLKILEARRSPDDLDLLSTAANLGVCYRETGRLAEAIPLLMRLHLVTPRPATLKWATNSLFEALLRLEPAAAAKHWARLVPILRKDPGEDDLTTLIARVNFGSALSRARQFAEAEAVLQAAIADEVRVLREGHEILLNTRTCLGQLYLLQERYDPAEALLRRCLEEREKAAPGSFRVATTQSLLGRALAGRGKHAEAEALLRAARDGLVKHAGTTPVWAGYFVPDTLRALAELCEGQGREVDAAKWRAELGAHEARAGSRAKR